MLPCFSTRLDKLANAWFFAWIAAAAACFAGWSPLSRLAATPTHAPSLTTVSAERGSERNFRAIEQIKVGDRVATNVPQEVWESDFVSLDEDTVDRPDVDPSSWRLVRMYGETEVGGEVLDDHRIETLQHVDWLKHHRVQVGSPCPVPLDLEEMDSDPDLKVVATEIFACPPIKPGKGRIVMTTVNHFNVDVWNLVVEDESGRRETIKPTGKHRFYSMTHARGVATQDLALGEYLLGDAGPLSVVSLQRELGKQRVYNMTVQGEHVYRVSLLGVLTHNTYDMHHGTPRQVIKEARSLYGVDPADIQGVRGKPNRVAIDTADHRSAHAGGHNGGMPRYNSDFQNRLAQLRASRDTPTTRGTLTASDYWDIRKQMLWEYFGIP